MNRDYNNNYSAGHASSNPFASNKYKTEPQTNYQNHGYQNPMYQAQSSNFRSPQQYQQRSSFNQSYGSYHQSRGHQSYNHGYNQSYHQHQSFGYQSGYQRNSSRGGFDDWDDIKNCMQKEFNEKAPVVKNFYEPHPDLENFKKEEVLAWRQENHEITLTSMSTNPDTKKAHIRIKPTVEFHHAFGNDQEIMRTIQAQGFEKPTPIQAQIWPAILQGYDTVGIAQTGTGKTLAFLMPMFIHIMSQPTLLKQRKGPSALILSPTRELALQIESEILKYKYRGLRVACVYGGGNKNIQLRAIAAGVEIIVATPGRMNDLLSQGQICLDDVTNFLKNE